ncbi:MULTISPECIES: hypothetical protein [unclassified Leifsonia]|uniref:hypothetical protein n=1 Tax=unclassified Leifsonia TaxID=2663824 RepID=UPI00117BB9EE|nr:hypothetical protein [Leifsonia sp. NCR5]
MQDGSGGARATCPSCGAEAHVVRNPYYGAGLAVHELIVECPQCGVSFLDTVPVAHEDAPPKRRGLGARLLALFGR